jgi:hypothetical protein
MGHRHKVLFENNNKVSPEIQIELQKTYFTWQTMQEKLFLISYLSKY